MNNVTWIGQEVRDSADLQRILALPRRRWSDDDLKAIHAGIDPLVRRPYGTMSLFPRQAQALFEFANGSPYGLFCPLSVGDGKSLISFLAPLPAQSYRPLLLIPAFLKKKTEADIRKYSDHFKIPNYIKVFTYEALALVQNENFLKEYKPDLIICDEGNYLKSRGAGRTKRILWYMEENPSTKFVLLSGTITSNSVMEYAHLLRLALRNNSPLPIDYRQLKDWAKHLDKRENRIAPGALVQLCTGDEMRLEEPVRHAYQRRLNETNGVIASDAQDGYNGSLYIDFERVALPEILANELAKMRKDFKTPNGESFNDGLEMFRHVSEMAVGYYNHWDPLPTPEWLAKRKLWHGIRSHILRYNHRQLATPLHVTNAVDHGLYPEVRIQGIDYFPPKALAEWREIRDATPKHRTIPAWISFFLVDHITHLVKHAAPTLIWVNQVPFGLELARRSGMPYYANEGIDAATGRSIEEDPGGRSIILSVDSNFMGRNLQDRWSRNLLINPPTKAWKLEQLAGRTHRRGQRDDEVLLTVIVTCLEHEFAIQNAIAEARYVKQTTGQSNKILLADFLQPFTDPAQTFISP